MIKMIKMIKKEKKKKKAIFYNKKIAS